MSLVKLKKTEFYFQCVLIPIYMEKMEDNCDSVVAVEDSMKMPVFGHYFSRKMLQCSSENRSKI